MPSSAPRPPELPEGRDWGRLGGELAGTVFGYVRGQLIIFAALVVLYTAAFGLLRVWLWPLVGPVCAILHLIPVFGTPLLIVASLGAAWAGGASFERVLAVLGANLAILTFEAYFLTPRVLGRRLGISPLWVFLATLVGGLAFGFLGVILAPLALALGAVVWRFARRPASSPGPGIY